METRQFVVQEHTTPDGVHWDLMLESEGVLLTFRLAEPPEAVRDHPVEAEPIFDHPMRFLTYEGPVQQGTGRVHIVDQGRYAEHCRTETRRDLHFDGAVLDGDFVLSRTDRGHLFALGESEQRRSE